MNNVSCTLNNDTNIWPYEGLHILIRMTEILNCFINMFLQYFDPLNILQKLSLPKNCPLNPPPCYFSSHATVHTVLPVAMRPQIRSLTGHCFCFPCDIPPGMLLFSNSHQSYWYRFTLREQGYFYVQLVADFMVKKSYLWEKI